MKHLLLAVAICSFSNLIAQQKEILLHTSYGSDNKAIHDVLRFEGIEIIDLEFTGNSLKGTDYRILVKEFTNGRLANTDTIVSTKSDDYLKPIDTSAFDFKFIAKTQLNNKIKMLTMFDGFHNTKLFDIKATNDQYALHDFLTESKPMAIEVGDPTYILGYFLPYLDNATGWKKYCEVAGSEHSPEDWGKVFDIPNYFLIEILFE